VIKARPRQCFFMPFLSDQPADHNIRQITYDPGSALADMDRSNRFNGINTTDPVINAQTRAPILVAIAISFGLASLTLVSLRIYTRWRLVKDVGADDVTIVIAEVSHFEIYPGVFPC
jgi:hypothetical protein